MSRARLYVLIDAFEHDMRGLVEKFVLGHLSEEEVLGSEYETAAAMRARDGGDDPIGLVHYLYLQQCFDILNRYRRSLPAEVGEELHSSSPRIGQLTQIRNRVMHGRPLRVDDPEIAISILTSFTSRHWGVTRDTLGRLQADDSWEPLVQTLPALTEKVLHNLPSADYDETGLVGRTEAVTDLRKLVERRREAIITITGEGGIGKTALALEVAYSIVDNPSSPFDCVLWVSLKTEMLTAYGVRELSAAVRDVTGATETLGRVLDASFSGSVKDLADTLSGIATLIVIDNLETARGSEVINLYDTLPDSVTYLFTSRLGIGEIERRYSLPALQLNHACQMFRIFAKIRRVPSLTRLSQTAVEEIVARLRCSPLAIRWYILSVEAGKEPLTTLRDQRELLEFCVSNVYASLSDKTKVTLDVLRALDKPASFDELAILTDMPIDDLREASQEMSRGSLVLHSPDPDGGIVGRMSLSSAARLYLPLDTNPTSLSSQVLKREQDYVKQIERRRSEEANRKLGPNVVRVRGPEDEPTAHLLRLALARGKVRDHTSANDLIARARSLNPDFWEVDRVSAFIASSSGQTGQASTLYRSALSKSANEESEGIISHFYAGHLARAMHDVELALPFARRAHSILNTADTALGLGNLLVWSHQFAEGQNLLADALDAPDAKTQLIARTAMVESWRRWSERLYEEKAPAEAFQKAAAGVDIGFRSLSAGKLDLKLADSIVTAITSALRSAAFPSVSTNDVIQNVTRILDQTEQHLKLLRNSPRWSYLISALSAWVRDVRPTGDVNTAAQRLITTRSSITDSSSPLSEATLVGSIMTFNGTYGFIRHTDHPENIFFHASSVDSGAHPSLTPGSVVAFFLTLDERGRKRAQDIRIMGDHDTLQTDNQSEK